jgi:hypothetical protein
MDAHCIINLCGNLCLLLDVDEAGVYAVSADTVNGLLLPRFLFDL